MNSIRTKLLLWYVGSLIITSLFFWFAIHEYTIHHGVEIFVALVLLLSTIGFLIIFRFVQSITELTNIMRNITDKNLDAKVPEKNSFDEISLLASSFNELLSRLHQAFKREQQFIADVAHELKTPLATMKSSLELSLKNTKNTDYIRMLKEVNRLSETLKDVLDLAWTESPEARSTGKKVHLSELVEDIGEIAEKMTVEKNLKMKIDIEKEVVVQGHKDKLARALLNLVDNAIKYTEKGVITISLKSEGFYAVVSVQDTGTGISKEEQKNIFTRFYRGKKTDSIFGSGLGLAITKSIIMLHNGTISVKSIEGKGSLFTVILKKS
jgi:signal transduction histidine kinase